MRRCCWTQLLPPHSSRKVVSISRRSHAVCLLAKDECLGRYRCLRPDRGLARVRTVPPRWPGRRGRDDYRRTRVRRELRRRRVGVLPRPGLRPRLSGRSALPHLGADNAVADADLEPHIDVFADRKAVCDRTGQKWPKLEECLASYDFAEPVTEWDGRRVEHPFRRRTRAGVSRGAR